MGTLPLSLGLVYTYLSMACLFIVHVQKKKSQSDLFSFLLMIRPLKRTLRLVLLI